MALQDLTASFQADAESKKVNPGGVFLGGGSLFWRFVGFSAALLYDTIIFLLGFCFLVGFVMPLGG